MRFAHPQLLWIALAVMPLLALFLWWSWRRRMRLIRLFVQDRLLSDLTVGFDEKRELQRVLMGGGAAFFLLIALARPQWGVVWEETVQQGRDILVAVDTSRSMLAVDRPPNSRLIKARLATLDLAQQAKSDRLGLIAFAGSAFLQCPLTLDEMAFSQNVAGLDTEIIPQGGTAIAEAIDTAIKAFEKSGENHRVLVLMTDGEDHEGDIDGAIRRAKKAKLRIFTVGIGTPQGELIRVPDEQGQMGFLKDDDGNVVRSRLNERLLKQIAEDTGGFYLQLVGARPMEVLFKRGIDTLPKGDSSSKLTRSYREQYYWFVLLAAVLLALEMFWMKSRDMRPARRAAKPKATTFATILLLAWAGTVTATASSLSALKDYKSGNYTNAYSEFSRLAEERKDDRYHFNAGSAAYKAGDFEKARDHFAASTLAEDLGLQKKSYFNMGNTLFRLGAQSGEAEDREAYWEDAIQQFENTLQIDKNDPEAKANLQFVRQQLEKLQKQMEQPPQDKNGKSKKSKKKSSKNQQKQDGQGEGSEEQDSPEDQKDKEGGQKKKDERRAGNKKDEEKEKEGSGKKKDQKQRGQDQDGKDRSPDGGQRGEPDQKELEQMAAALKVMTEKQAQNVLDATKGEERTIIFQPPSSTAKANTGSKKDY